MATVTATTTTVASGVQGTEQGQPQRHDGQELMSQDGRLPRYSATKIEKGTRNTVMASAPACSPGVHQARHEHGSRGGEDVTPQTG